MHWKLGAFQVQCIGVRAVDYWYSYLAFYYLKFHGFQLQGRRNQDLRLHLNELSNALRKLDVIEEHAESARRRNDILDLTFMGVTGKAFLGTVLFFLLRKLVVQLCFIRDLGTQAYIQSMISSFSFLYYRYVRAV